MNKVALHLLVMEGDAASPLRSNRVLFLKKIGPGLSDLGEAGVVVCDLSLLVKATTEVALSPGDLTTY